MKSLLAIFTILSALMLMSCSNVEQDLSPVGPEMQKISAFDGTGTYPYLTTFNFIPIESFTIVPGNDIIEVTVGSRGWSDNLKHIYIVLEYVSKTDPSADRMVYLEKPKSSTFKLDNLETEGLKDIKVYGYEPVSDNSIQHPYFPQQSFNNIGIQWSANEKEIQILIQGPIQDTFVEITNDEGTFVTFIGVPDSKQIFIPNYGNPETTNVKLYCM